MSADVVAFGEPLVAMYPARDGAASSGPGAKERYTMTWGGDASNYVLAAAKLGARSAILTRVGNDAFGDRFVDLWKSGGVDTALVQRDITRSTGLYFAVFTGTSHSMVYYRSGSAATAVARDEIDWDRLAQAKLLHVSGISQAIADAMTDLSFELMRFAREHGALVSYDVNYRPPLWPASRAAAIARYSALEYADLFTITDEEMRALGLGERPEDLARTLGVLPRHTIVKCGADGAVIVRRDGTRRFDGHNVEVRDTVGAGDAFDAAVATQILEGASLDDAVEFAVATGALVCTGEGPLERQPAREEVERLLRNHKDKEH